MKTALRVFLSGILVVLVLCYGILFQADALEDVEKIWNYEEHVPKNMRELVPEAKYRKLFRELSELRDPLDLLDNAKLLTTPTIIRIAASPCGDAMTYLAVQYATDPATQEALVEINEGFQELPIGYVYPKKPGPNPWGEHANATGLVRQMLKVFTDWAIFLPEISGSHDNGLKYIQYFSWFYYKNPAAQDFVQGRDPVNEGKKLDTGLKFTRDFSNQRGAFMNDKVSVAKVSQWVNDPRIEISDYESSNYQSWNDFFARRIKIDTDTETIPSRPATMPLSEYPERDYIVVAPTDCIVNPLIQVLQEDGTTVRRYVENPLQHDVVLDVKSIPISLMDLLGSAPKELKEKFVDGTGLSCVLMPNTYHHFHAPVNGKIVHAEIVRSGTYGYEDFPNWVPLDGNVGRPGTDFGQFQVFQRGVIIIEVKYKDLNGKTLTGYVASIPVGLDTIGSVVLDEDIVPGKIVKRGYTRLGNFFYGGSLDILLFSKGLASGVVQARLGTQITLFNIGERP